MKEQMPMAEGENQERMGLEEAHEEANMMQVKLKESLGHEPTSADYDEALRLVEEMRELAANEPNSEKVQNEIMRRLDNVGTSIAGALMSMLTLGARPDKDGDVKWLEERQAFWDDAASDLKRLKKKSEKMAQGQG